MVDLEKRILPKGSIVNFPGFGLHILAHIGDSRFNLIGLTDGHQKTTSWKARSHDAVEIPENTWFNGGPPVVVHIPMPNNYNEAKVMSLISSDVVKCEKNYNKRMIQCIKDALL